MLSEIHSRSEIIETLQQYGKSADEIKDIFCTLMASGTGEYIAWSVIENPKLLSEYLRMKKNGISDIEIMSHLRGCAQAANNMRIRLAIIISLLTSIIGVIFSKSYILIPFSFLIASIIELPTRRWVASERLGRWTSASMIVKFLFALIGFYALIGQIVCVIFIIWWFVF